MASDLPVSRLIKATFGLAFAAAAGAGLVNIMLAVGRWDGRPDITDFHAFYAVGQMIRSGHFAEAYDASSMLSLEEALGGRPVFMPWSYPPLFGAVVAPLAALPLGAAFLVFVTATLGLYLWATRRLDAEARWPVLMASTVSIILNLRCGQNGLLTAGIVAAAAAYGLERRERRAGLFLALMAFKPHLIPLVPFGLVAQRRWLTLAVAGAGALVLTGLSLALFGSAVFAAFLHGLSEVGRLMALGAYPLHRMTSIFAFGLAAGLPSRVAMLLHGAVALVLLAVVARLGRRRPDPRLRLGLAVLAGFFISPYVYDYDLVLFGVGLILVSPALRRCVSVRRYVAILAGFAVAQTLGVGVNALVEHHPGLLLSPAGPAMLAVFCSILVPLWRATGRTAAPGLAPLPLPGPLVRSRAA